MKELEDISLSEHCLHISCPPTVVSSTSTKPSSGYFYEEKIYDYPQSCHLVVFFHPDRDASLGRRLCSLIFFINDEQYIEK
jgi:hypothetical protein